METRRNKLKNIFKGKVVIVGIGNTMKGDDGFGPALIERLKGKVNIPLIDAGQAPENYVGKIVEENPDIVLLADCAHLGLTPGQYDILKEEDVFKSGFTTHDISAGMFIEYLKKRTNAKIYMLGVQPQSISFGSDMSDAVKQATQHIADILGTVLPNSFDYNELRINL